MFRNRHLFALLTSLCVIPTLSRAEPATWQAIPASATFTTGDTWNSEGVTFRLYGVQSCLRGTLFTGKDGTKHDCGDASMMMLINLIQEWHPLCYPVYHSPDNVTQFVICSARINSGNSSGSVVDLGTALVSSGFAFAALNSNAQPVNPSYLVSQTLARKGQRGLWAFPDIQDPNEVIMRDLAKSNSPAVPKQ